MIGAGAYTSDKAVKGWSYTKEKLGPMSSKLGEKLAPYKTSLATNVYNPLKESVAEGSKVANDKIEANPKLKEAKEATKQNFRRASTYMWSLAGYKTAKEEPETLDE